MDNNIVGCQRASSVGKKHTVQIDVLFHKAIYLSEKDEVLSVFTVNDRK